MPKNTKSAHFTKSPFFVAPAVVLLVLAIPGNALGSEDKVGKLNAGKIESLLKSLNANDITEGRASDRVSVLDLHLKLAQLYEYQTQVDAARKHYQAVLDLTGDSQLTDEGISSKVPGTCETH